MSVISSKVTKSAMFASLKESLSEILLQCKTSDVEMYGKLLDFQKAMTSTFKVVERTKRKRTNANTGLGMPRKVSKNMAMFLKDVKQCDDECKSRAEVTNILTSYIKENSLQMEDKKLFFRLDENLVKLFDVKTLKDVNKFCELSCVVNRIDGIDVMQYISDNNLLREDSVCLDEKLQDLLSLTVQDLISWQELQKILYKLFE
jgi:chromatin remodeling complex protein RSC6